jgi:hypothetical protein
MFCLAPNFRPIASLPVLRWVWRGGLRLAPQTGMRQRFAALK